MLMTRRPDGSEAHCAHSLADPIDVECDACRVRGQARVRKSKSRGIDVGPNGPVPGLGGVSRRQVEDLWKAVPEAREILRYLEAQAAEYRRRSKTGHLPLPADLVQAVARAAAVLDALQSVGEHYERATLTVFPPLDRP